MTTEPEPRDTEYVFESVADSGEEFMQDPTSSADPIETSKRNKKLKIFGLTLLGLVTLGLVVFLSLQFFEDSEEPTGITPPMQTQAPLPNDQADPTAPVQEPVTPETENPVQDLYPDAPTVRAGEVAITLNENTVETSDGDKFALEGSELELPTYICKVNMETTDFCLAAKGTVGETVFNVYYLKDAVNSKLFQDPNYWVELEVAGSSGAGLLPLPMGADSEFPTIVALNSNSSGWMAVFQEADQDKVEEFASRISLN